MCIYDVCVVFVGGVCLWCVCVLCVSERVCRCAVYVVCVCGVGLCDLFLV